MQCVHCFWKHYCLNVWNTTNDRCFFSGYFTIILWLIRKADFNCVCIPSWISLPPRKEVICHFWVILTIAFWLLFKMACHLWRCFNDCFKLLAFHIITIKKVRMSYWQQPGQSWSFVIFLLTFDHSHVVTAAYIYRFYRWLLLSFVSVFVKPSLLT